MSQIFGESIENRCWRYFIWGKAVAVSKHNGYRPEWRYLRLKIIRQTAKLNTPPIILRVRYRPPENRVLTVCIGAVIINSYIAI